MYSFHMSNERHIAGYKQRAVYRSSSLFIWLCSGFHHSNLLCWVRCGEIYMGQLLLKGNCKEIANKLMEREGENERNKRVREHTVFCPFQHNPNYCPQRPRSFRLAPRIATSSWARFSEHAQSIRFLLPFFVLLANQI